MARSASATPLAIADSRLHQWNIICAISARTCGVATTEDAGSMPKAHGANKHAINNSGKYPDSLEVLCTPDSNGHTYLQGYKSIPKDPWKNEYLYEPPHTGQPLPRIYTLGKDGQPGGEGEDADIDNFTIREGDGKK